MATGTSQQQLARLMGGWKVKGNKRKSTQNFAAARLALLQAALARGFGNVEKGMLNPEQAAWAPQFNALAQYFAQHQTNQTNPAEQYRDVSQLFNNLSTRMGQSDPRQFLLAMLQGSPGQFNPRGGSPGMGQPMVPVNTLGY